MKDNQRGVNLLSFATIVPGLIFMTAAIVDVGRWLQSSEALREALDETRCITAVDGTCQNIIPAANTSNYNWFLRDGSGDQYKIAEFQYSGSGVFGQRTIFNYNPTATRYTGATYSINRASYTFQRTKRTWSGAFPYIARTAGFPTVTEINNSPRFVNFSRPADITGAANLNLSVTDGIGSWQQRSVMLPATINPFSNSNTPPLAQFQSCFDATSTNLPPTITASGNCFSGNNFPFTPTGAQSNMLNSMQGTFFMVHITGSHISDTLHVDLQYRYRRPNGTFSNWVDLGGQDAGNNCGSNCNFWVRGGSYCTNPNNCGAFGSYQPSGWSGAFHPEIFAYAGERIDFRFRLTDLDINGTPAAYRVNDINLWHPHYALRYDRQITVDVPVSPSNPDAAANTTNAPNIDFSRAVTELVPGPLSVSLGCVSGPAPQYSATRPSSHYQMVTSTTPTCQTQNYALPCQLNYGSSSGSGAAVCGISIPVEATNVQYQSENIFFAPVNWTQHCISNIPTVSGLGANHPVTPYLAAGSVNWGSASVTTENFYGSAAVLQNTISNSSGYECGNIVTQTFNSSSPTTNTPQNPFFAGPILDIGCNWEDEVRRQAILSGLPAAAEFNATRSFAGWRRTNTTPAACQQFGLEQNNGTGTEKDLGIYPANQVPTLCQPAPYLCRRELVGLSTNTQPTTFDLTTLEQRIGTTFAAAYPAASNSNSFEVDSDISGDYLTTRASYKLPLYVLGNSPVLISQTRRERLEVSKVE